MTVSSGPVLIADRYEVGELLGRGGMADVYAGTDRRLDRPVAIKRLRPDMAARDDIRVRFESEARTAAMLSHPNAVSVFDTGEHNGIPYIVMQRLPGETLGDRMAGGPIDPDWLRSVALEVLDALAAAHAAGIVHRDVKPGNILIGADGRAMIADFGIAKSVQAGDLAAGPVPDPTATGQWVGTPAYLAPERLTGGPATPQSDLYALGVVLYEALTGRKPFTGDSPFGTAQAIVGGDHPPVSSIREGLDPALVVAVERAMAPDPAQRFATAADMAAALAPGAATATTQAVAVASADDTQVFGGSGDGADYAGPGDAVVLRRRWRRVWIWAAIGAVGLALMFVLAQSADDPNPGSDAAAQTESPEMELARKLRAQAATLSPADGPAAAEAARRLEELAGAVERDEGGPPATALVASVGEWNREGDLSDQATGAIVALLQQVQGVDMSVLTPPTTAPAPASNRTPRPAVENDKGKDKGQDEDKKQEEGAPSGAESQVTVATDGSSTGSPTDGGSSSSEPGTGAPQSSGGDTSEESSGLGAGSSN
jgi:serine/threonine-protein kinase